MNRMEPRSKLLTSSKVWSGLIVIGRTCSGKTTVADYASRRYGFHFIEASSVMRAVGSSVAEDGIDTIESKEAILEGAGRDIVARRIIDTLGKGPQGPFVISGFRAVEEVDTFRRVAPGTRLILIKAGLATRFQRQLERGRNDAVASIAVFEAYDREQDTFGLLPVAEQLADICIVNEGSLADLYAQIDAIAAHIVGFQST
jgi:dephospho-CoA kinase